MLRTAKNMYRLSTPLLANTARCFSAGTSQPGPHLDDSGEPRFLEQVRMYVDEAAAKAKVNPQYLPSIKECNNVLRFHITITRDDGSLECVPAYR